VTTALSGNIEQQNLDLNTNEDDKTISKEGSYRQVIRIESRNEVTKTTKNRLKGISTRSVGSDQDELPLIHAMKTRDRSKTNI
jgi:hypothetical protein